MSELPLTVTKLVVHPDVYEAIKSVVNVQQAQIGSYYIPVGIILESSPFMTRTRGVALDNDNNLVCILAFD